jgi:hypothetical protein
VEEGFGIVEDIAVAAAVDLNSRSVLDRWAVEGEAVR